MQGHTPSLPCSTWLKPAHKAPTLSGSNPILAEANPPIVVAWDLIALKQAFPCLFDIIGNMPCTYTIRTDPSIPPVQHTHRVLRSNWANP